MKEKDNNLNQNGQDNKLKIGISIAIILVVLIVILAIIMLNSKTPKYTMTFETNGGSVIDPVIVEANATLTRPEDPVRENYKFVGWYYNDELYDFSKPITKDMELEARWEALGTVSGVKLNQTEIALNIGDTYKLVATITPEDATNKSLTWSSSDSNIVSVDAEGNLKAQREGTATITVTTVDGNYTASVTISVKKTEDTSNNSENDSNTDNNQNNKPTVTVINVKGVSLNTTTLNLTEGGTSKLTATINPHNANNKNVTWKSSNPDIVSVDSNGNIKALKPGTATITVTTKDGNYTATCQVTVDKKPDTYKVIFTPKVQEGTGAVVQYTVAVTKNGSSLSDYNFIRYNGTIVKKTLAITEYNRNITSATIRLSDGSEVTATVVYN